MISLNTLILKAANLFIATQGGRPQLDINSAIREALWRYVQPTNTFLDVDTLIWLAANKYMGVQQPDINSGIMASARKYLAQNGKPAPQDINTALYNALRLYVGLDDLFFADFRANYYVLNGVEYNNFTSIPGATSTGGAGFGTVQRNGVWQSVPANAPLIGDNGLGVYEARTNSIRNPTALGAALPALPTNWGVGAPAGITVTPVGRGVEGGLPYIDFQFSGTNNSGGTLFPNVTFEMTDVVCAAGETWTISCFGKLISGALPGGCALLMQQRASGAFVTNAGPAMSFGATLAETRGSAAMSATVNQVRPLASFTWPNLATATFVVRFAAPNLKLGPDINDPPILQTSGLPATRTAVAQSVGGLGSILTPPYVLYVEADMPAADGVTQVLATVGTGAGTNRMLLARTTSNPARVVMGNGGAPPARDFPDKGGARTLKLAARVGPGGFQASCDGVLSTFSGGTPNPSPDTIWLGQSNQASTYLNGYIRRVRILPDMDDAAFQGLTA